MIANLGSSLSHYYAALLSMVHSWTKHTDGTSSTVRGVLFDYRKAFNLIDHTILTGRLVVLDIPHGILSWIIDFRKYRKQRVKLDQDCKYGGGNIPSGVPQGAKLGPWLFISMIDDINTSDTETWWYVDDTTIASLWVRTKRA